MLKLDKNLQERLYLKHRHLRTRVTVKIEEQVVKDTQNLKTLKNQSKNTCTQTAMTTMQVTTLISLTNYSKRPGACPGRLTKQHRLFQDGLFQKTQYK